jgi:hypothetical protein
MAPALAAMDDGPELQMAMETAAARLGVAMSQVRAAVAECRRIWPKR